MRAQAWIGEIWLLGYIFSKLGLETAGEDHRRVLAVLAYLRET